MLLNPTPDQTLLRETTASFLDRYATPDAVRSRRGDPAGFDLDSWQQGAELGWTSLLVSEQQGGGAIAEHGLIDLSLVAHEFGRHAAPGPLIPTNVVLALLDRRGDDDTAATVAALMAGTSTAAWCLTEAAPCDRPGTWSLDVRVDGDDLVLDGVKRPVEGAGTADVLLVTGRTDDGFTNVLLPATTPGVTVRPLTSFELTRRYGVVEFDGVRVPRSTALGEIGRADDDVWWCFDLTLALGAAESVGAMERIFDMTVEWAFDRYAFGRPLASYQALKHRFADMKTWLEASHAIADAAVRAVATGDPQASELASAAAAYVGHHGAELGQDCIQIHGGIGVTFEHDLHVFMRRIVANRTAYGSPSDHRRRLADLLEQQMIAGQEAVA
jgi:alkylation response protein AidB-like acyl-CoA dehydrogenase